MISEFRVHRSSNWVARKRSPSSTAWWARFMSEAYWNWRDRCAYAGYYCLYAEYGYVYHYPFDDRPVAHARYRRYR